MNEYPLVVGQKCSFAEMSISLGIYGGPTFKTADFSAFDWDDSLTPEKIKGTSPYVIGRTVGEYDANASMTMYYAKSVEFQAELAKIDERIGLVEFDVMLQWAPLRGDGTVYTVKIVSARLMGRSVSSAAGPEATAKEMALSVIRIEENGVSLV